MPDRRGRKASLEDLIPEDRVSWAREIWADRAEVAKLASGAWMLREAAKLLGLPEETVDEALKLASRRSRHELACALGSALRTELPFMMTDQTSAL